MIISFLLILKAEISWFNFPIILKLKNKKRDRFVKNFYKLGIETRPIISGTFQNKK